MSESGLLKWDMRMNSPSVRVADGHRTGCCDEAWLRKEYRLGGDLQVQVSSLLLRDGEEFIGSLHARCI